MDTPRDMAVLNVLSMQSFTSDEEFFVVYMKFFNAALEPVNGACILMDLNI